MKSGIEDGDLRDAFADDSVHGFDGGELEAVVRGREFGLRGDRGANFGRDDDALAILGAAVHDAMADHVDARGKVDLIQAGD